MSTVERLIRHGLAQSVTDGNRGKADAVAMFWQQMFTRAAHEEKRNRQRFLQFIANRGGYAVYETKQGGKEKF